MTHFFAICSSFETDYWAKLPGVAEQLCRDQFNNDGCHLVQKQRGVGDGDDGAVEIDQQLFKTTRSSLDPGGWWAHLIEGRLAWRPAQTQHHRFLNLPPDRS
jgi:hypothetical protein